MMVQSPAYDQITGYGVIQNSFIASVSQSTRSVPDAITAMLWTMLCLAGTFLAHLLAGSMTSACNSNRRVLRAQGPLYKPAACLCCIYCSALR